VKVANAVARKSIGPDRLWQAVEGVGYLDVLAAGASEMVEAATILRAAGHHAARIPWGETMLARWLCAACGLEAPTGALTIGPVKADDRLAIADDAVSGHASYILWGRATAAVVLIADNTLLLVERAAATFASETNLAGEPRDHLDEVG
jgi:acyl-CoA dehydrogenase